MARVVRGCARGNLTKRADNVQNLSEEALYDNLNRVIQTDTSKDDANTKGH